MWSRDRRKVVHFIRHGYLFLFHLLHQQNQQTTKGSMCSFYVKTIDAIIYDSKNTFNSSFLYKQSSNCWMCVVSIKLDYASKHNPFGTNPLWVYFFFVFILKSKMKIKKFDTTFHFEILSNQNNIFLFFYLKRKIKIKNLTLL